MSSTTTMRVLSAGTLALLEAGGYTTALVNGTRKVSNNSYMSLDSTDSQATIEVPEDIESAKTFEFLQLKPDVAQNLFETFLAGKAVDPDRADILEHAKNYVRSVPGNAVLQSDDWFGIMNRIGVSASFQNRIMVANFTHWRLSASVKETIIWMMEERFEFLNGLDKVIQHTPKFVQKKTSQLGLNGKIEHKTPVIPLRGSSISKTQPAIGTFSTQGLPTSKVAEPPSELPGYTIFYKGGTMVRLGQVFGASDKLEFQKLLSTPPCDFDVPLTQSLYFTKQEAVAFDYAGWAKQVVDGNVVPVGVLSVAVPQNLLASVFQVVGETWRKYVWVCRKREVVPDDLKHLSNYQWLTGPLCKLSPVLFDRRVQDSSEIPIWKLPKGETASQHATSSPQMVTLLNSHCVGKVWLNFVGTGGIEAELSSSK